MPYKKSIKQVHCLVIASGINKRDKAYPGLTEHEWKNCYFNHTKYFPNHCCRNKTTLALEKRQHELVS